MKLVIQCCCLNEEKTLGAVLTDIPKKIPGITTIDVVIVDDGCTDKTVAIAKKHGVKHIVRHARTQGLGTSFKDALATSLSLGADIIVHTDGDNQYPGKSIPALIKPIIKGTADMVIADRQVQDIAHFSATKKLLQRIGTWTLNKAAGTNVPDAPSGFRAYSRQAAIRLNPITRFSYTMETLIQAGNKGLAITSVPITTNAKMRESRLFRSYPQYLAKSGAAIIRAFIMYRPLAFFLTIGVLVLVLGLVPFGRFFYFIWWLHEVGVRHIQSLITGGVLISTAFLLAALGIIADLIRINRSLVEENLEHTKRMRFNSKR